MIDKREAITSLKSKLRPGSTVYTIVKRVAPSGMSRHISVLIARDNEIIDITFWVAPVLDYKISDKTDALIVSGTGMDMGFHVVYELSRVLYEKGFNDRDTGKRNNNGGYALKQSWL